MAYAELTNPPQTIEDWVHFSFANSAHHHDIIRIIQRDRNKTLDDFMLDPISLKEGWDNWLYLHATMHQQMNAALGIQGYDLSQLDPEDPEDLETWIAAHADEHFRAGQVLNLE